MIVELLWKLIRIIVALLLRQAKMSDMKRNMIYNFFPVIPSLDLCEYYFLFYFDYFYSGNQFDFNISSLKYLPTELFVIVANDLTGLLSSSDLPIRSGSSSYVVMAFCPFLSVYSSSSQYREPSEIFFYPFARNVTVHKFQTKSHFQPLSVLT